MVSSGAEHVDVSVFEFHTVKLHECDRFLLCFSISKIALHLTLVIVFDRCLFIMKTTES